MRSLEEQGYPTAPVHSFSRLETTRALFFILLDVKEILKRNYLLFSLHKIYAFCILFIESLSRASFRNTIFYIDISFEFSSLTSY